MNSFDDATGLDDVGFEAVRAVSPQAPPGAAVPLPPTAAGLLAGLAGLVGLARLRRRGGGGN